MNPYFITQLNWQDTFRYAAAFSFNIMQQLRWDFGYALEKAAVLEKNLDPKFLNAKNSMLGTGLNVEWSEFFSTQLSYAYVHYDTIHIDSKRDVYPENFHRASNRGTYTLQEHIVSFASAVNF